MIVLFFIIAYPVSKLLDFLLGKDAGTFYRRAELKELVDMNDIASESNTDLISRGISILYRLGIELLKIINLIQRK